MEETRSLRRPLMVALGGGVAAVNHGAVWAARPQGVNQPELLPKTAGAETPLIDVIKLLGSSQRRAVLDNIRKLEQGPDKIKLRVLCQTYPSTPGLAIRDYWGVDDSTLIYVHDTGGLGPAAVVNFQAGAKVEAIKPLSFWRQ
eukprot:2393664-Amphidinium_carterae.1